MAALYLFAENRGDLHRSLPAANLDGRKPCPPQTLTAAKRR
jgi:hypothetical protein